MKNIKALMVGMVAGTMILSTACTANAAFNFNFSYTNSKSTSETKTVEDSMGDTYEVTHTVETVNGETTEFFENVPCEIFNETEEDITALFIAPSEDDTWGENILEAVGDDFVLEENGHIWGMNMSYHPDTTKFDVKVEFANETSVEFKGCGMNELDDAYHINVEIVGNGDGNYTLYMV